MLPQNNMLALINDIFILFFVFIALFTFKGFMQAFLAKIMGDSTGKDEGFLSINPIAHIEIFGLTTILIVYLLVSTIFSESVPRSILFILLVAFGAHMIKPVPINDDNFKYRKWGGILTSLAGPISNFILAMLSIIGLRILVFNKPPQYVFISIFGILNSIINISIIFGIIDLIPIPPFDGGKIFRYALPYSLQYVIDWLEEYSFFILVVLFFAPIISDYFFGTISAISQIIKHIMFNILVF